jgi:hypothetical protein
MNIQVRTTIIPHERNAEVHLKVFNSCLSNEDALPDFYSQAVVVSWFMFLADDNICKPTILGRRIHTHMFRKALCSLLTRECHCLVLIVETCADRTMSCTKYSVGNNNVVSTTRSNLIIHDGCVYYNKKVIQYCNKGLIN